MVKKISIVVPHYNKQESLVKVIDELKLQISPEDEILIIDDWSENPLPNIGCPCTRIIRPEKQKTHTYRLDSLRNLGLSQATNDAVIILDPDCLPNPGFIKSCKALFDPSILYAGCIDRRQPDGSIMLDRRNPDRESGWIDTRAGSENGGGVYGGCMMFSKSRTELAAWFSTDFDGSWGAEEHDFASRCFHSGIRLYYSLDMKVTHLPHPTNRPTPSKNSTLWTENVKRYAVSLNHVTPYKPLIGVSIITMMRPELIDQCLRSVFRNRIPVRVRLDVNGDSSPETMEALEPWRRRWAVEVVEHERIWPARVRNNALKWAVEEGYKLLLQLDDDMMIYPNAIPILVSAMENNPNIYACSGLFKGVGSAPRSIGGPLLDGSFNFWRSVSGMKGSDWVGGGFTIHRLDPLILYDERYETGYNDYDWSMEARKQGMKLAVCGDAGSYHGVLLTPEGLKTYRVSGEYAKIRYDHERHARMRALFKSKWGFEPRDGWPIEN